MTTNEQQEFKKKVLDQFVSGKTLLVQMENVIEKAFQAEMDSHLDSDERSKGKKRNTTGHK